MATFFEGCPVGVKGFSEIGEEASNSLVDNVAVHLLSCGQGTFDDGAGHAALLADGVVNEGAEVCNNGLAVCIGCKESRR